MMLKKMFGAAAAASLAVTPCFAADLNAGHDAGSRRSSAVAGMYLSLPLGGRQKGKTQAGFRLQMAHDYRSASAPTASLVRATALDLRLVGDKRPTFYVANVPLTGEEARKRNLVGGGTLVTAAILAAAVVGGIVIYNALTDGTTACIPEDLECIKKLD